MAMRHLAEAQRPGLIDVPGPFRPVRIGEADVFAAVMREIHVILAQGLLQPRRSLYHRGSVDIVAQLAFEARHALVDDRPIPKALGRHGRLQWKRRRQSQDSSLARREAHRSGRGQSERSPRNRLRGRGGEPAARIRNAFAFAGVKLRLRVRSPKQRGGWSAYSSPLFLLHSGDPSRIRRRCSARMLHLTEQHVRCLTAFKML